MPKQQPPYGLRLPPDLKAWVKETARQEGRSINNFIVQVLSQARSQEAPTEQK